MKAIIARAARVGAVVLGTLVIVLILAGPWIATPTTDGDSWTTFGRIGWDIIWGVMVVGVLVGLGWGWDE